MKAYHGTNAVFEEFDSSFCKTASGNEQYGSGFYFTNHEETAKGYGNLIYEVELRIDKPYELNNGETTHDILLTPYEVKEIMLQHPNIYAPCDSEVFANPLGDYSEKFWSICTPENPNLEKDIRAIVSEVVDEHFKEASLLGVDMFYEMSNALKRDFLEAVNKITGHDGVIVKGTNDIDIVVAWFPEQIEIQEIKGLEKRKQKKDIER